jgi:bacterial leucyl aminopeptidase
VRLAGLLVLVSRPFQAHGDYADVQYAEDDNGSGSMTILEAFRILLSDPAIAAGEAEQTIEFHWYAAEEVGLLGSADIWDQYATEGADVAGMLQQDMTGFVREGHNGAMGLIQDYTDAALNEFMRTVIDAVS